VIGGSYLSKRPFEGTYDHGRLRITSAFPVPASEETLSP